MSSLQQVIEAFVTRAETVRAQTKAPGLAIGIAVDGEPVHASGLGFAHVATGVPMTADTVLGIGSVTKSMTCVAIMQLQEQGRLTVDDSVARYVPALRLPGASPADVGRITIAHLMAHTSGLPLLPYLFQALGPSLRDDPSASWHGLPPELADAPPLLTTDDLLRQLAVDDYSLLGPPGAWHSYSNEGYALLGAVIEAASGQSYEDYVTEHVLRAAGMESSSFVRPGPEKSGAGAPVAELYSLNPATGQPEETPGWWYAAPFSAAGFVRSTVKDMLRYLELFRTGGTVGSNRLLSATSVAAMTALQHRTAPGLGYGFGLHVSPDYYGMKIIEHGGGIKGTSAWICCVPNRGLTFAVMSNLGGVPADQPVTAALNVLAGLPPEQLRHEAPERGDLAGDVSACAGTYTSREGGALTLKADGHRLLFAAGGTDVPLRPVDLDTFLIPLGSGSLLRVHRAPDGTVGRISAGFPAGFRVFLRSH